LGKDIKIFSLNLKNFAFFKNQKISFNSKYTEIYGKNDTGKTVIADAIAYLLVGSNLWGNNFNPISDTNMAMVSGHVKIDNEVFKSFSKILQSENGKTRTISALKDKLSWVDKHTLLSILNPRYFCSLESSNIKQLITKFNLGDFELFDDYIEEEFDAEAKAIFEDGKSLIPVKGKDVIDIYNLCNVYVTENKVAINENESEMKISEGKIQAAKTFLNDKHFSPEQEKLFSDMIDENSQKIEELEIKISDLKNVSVRIKKFQLLMLSEIIKDFNKLLKFSELVLGKTNSNGEAVITMKFNGKEKEKLSNSEMLKMGLDFADAIAGITNYQVPTVIDNGEAIDTFAYKDIEWLDMYDNLNQVIILSTGKCDLSYYNAEENLLESIIDGSVMPRERETLPVTRIDCDIW
jgi:hypothetical protein